MPIALPHQNAKRLFAKRNRIGKEVGMAKACELVGLALAGTHHRALDDALNVARLLPWVLGNPVPAAGLATLEGVIPKPTCPVTTDEMHEAIGDHIKGNWMGRSPNFMMRAAASSNRLTGGDLAHLQDASAWRLISMHRSIWSPNNTLRSCRQSRYSFALTLACKMYV